MISILSEHYLLLSILSLLSFGIMFNLSPRYGYPALSSFWVFVCMLVLFNTLVLNLIDSEEGLIFFNDLFLKDRTEFVINGITLALGILLLLGFSKYNKEARVVGFEYYIFYLISIWSMVLLISSTEFLSFYFVLELQSMSFYLLAAFRKYERGGIEGGLKYFILSSISSILLLLGFSFLYAYTGSTVFFDFVMIHKNYSDVYLNSLSFILFFSGLLFKLYAAPFHLWVADIYEGSYLSVVGIFGVLPLLNLYHITWKLLGSLYEPSQLVIQGLLTIVVPLTLVVGTLGAIYQVKFKRLLAYSSITNIGYFLMGLFYYNESVGFISYLYIFFYSLTIFNFLLIISHLRSLDGTVVVENWYQLAGLYKKNKWLFTLFILVCFSMAGLPPFSIFFAKWLLLSWLWRVGNYMWIVLIIVVALITFYYYLRMIKQLTYYTSDSGVMLKPVSYTQGLTLVLVSMLNLLLGLYVFAEYLY